MARIIIPTPLRKFTGQNRDFVTEKDTLNGALQDLVAEYPDVESNLLDEEGNVRSFIKIYIGDDEVNPDKNGATSLGEDTEVSIVPAIAGGSWNTMQLRREPQWSTEFHREFHCVSPWFSV